MPFDLSLGYLLMVMLPGLVLSGLASWRVRSAFSRYSRVPSYVGMSGAQAAHLMLERAGIHDVRVVPTSGFLSDHYNPTNKTLALSQSVFQETSLAAIGVACHEAGHAIQHAEGYAPMWLRSAVAPAASIGSNFGYFVIFLGMIFQSGMLVLVGVALFSMMLLFQIITLPVEFDASARAKRLAFEHGIVREDERRGVAAVLNAAALTYVAAALTTALTVAYYLLRASQMGSQSDD
ncbi:MAG: zinc metallopeptidase [Pirellulaceae bacterium]